MLPQQTKDCRGHMCPLPVTNRVKASAFGGSDLIASWLRSSPQNGILSLIKMHFSGFRFKPTSWTFSSFMQGFNVLFFDFMVVTSFMTWTAGVSLNTGTKS